ncbi:FkbM family methyltransferase [Rufibacter sp. LB8]|uniref:FkbM family methyltransferase n=1 Tax=Rufibacter sp. LB8 TaxID=2777781 RepID=UPI00178C7CA2|nr:FkbM family methyltransferase [Rufibacter sp. LB8]
MKEIIKNVLKPLGVQIKRYPDDDLARRMKILKAFQVNTILDIGANSGQYALKMRELGFEGQIISFEPLQQAFSTLETVSAKDPHWQVHNYALGESDKKSAINVAGNSFSSSILNMMPKHEESAPASGYVAKQEIDIKRLDSVFPELVQPNSRVLAKIDTQGYEKNVLDGATASLAKIGVLQLEMSLVSLYENEFLFSEMLAYVKALGFDLYSLENGFADETTGQLLQVDGVFVHQDLLR